MAVKHETELYEPVKSFFEQRGYEVKSEVLHCDMVAVLPGGETTVIVEMKKTFTLGLLLQGVERLRLTDRVMLAVERNRMKTGAVNQRFGDLAELCRLLGLGLMTVTFFKTKKPVLEVLCEPGEPPVRGMRRKRQSRLLNEFKERSGDYNVGGSTKRKLVTSYREKALRCAWVLREEGPSAPRRTAELTGFGQAARMLRADHYGWFERVSRGLYRLRPTGEQALLDYADVVEAWLASRPAPASADGGSIDGGPVGGGSLGGDQAFRTSTFNPTCGP
ncbi:hypothetical protein BG53_15610 [Paenibacillus darwinianus]|uniref:Uncharacterized protein n=1 Tax=Paenibacillus darwinianus TaxID=1380763 RepID=A0A9W5S130_9BACL|nr:DUF2161 family putative PD-(D/E)XK-type phosphodiesterase [Paenibacillus darwinianus]EXX89485.1 hypothetical protein BG53_15610 [Paenibacillus darwinianus]EXX91184.1 hypothetical protein CH50_14035 [Paenibacillus darwinianus]EXX92522.1 hypothetical protein BG52_10770 [Paenibacillus darwinianus]